MKHIIKISSLIYLTVVFCISCQQVERIVPLLTSEDSNPNLAVDNLTETISYTINGPFNIKENTSVSIPKYNNITHTITQTPISSTSNNENVGSYTEWIMLNKNRLPESPDFDNVKIVRKIISFSLDTSRSILPGTVSTILSATNTDKEVINLVFEKYVSGYKLYEVSPASEPLPAVWDYLDQNEYGNFFQSYDIAYIGYGFATDLMGGTMGTSLSNNVTVTNVITTYENSSEKRFQIQGTFSGDIKGELNIGPLNGSSTYFSSEKSFELKNGTFSFYAGKGVL